MRTDIEIALTSHCNANCPTCARTDFNTFKKHDWLELRHLSTEEYWRVVDCGIDFGTITYCGEFGDPVMHPEIEQFIKSTIEKYPDTEIEISTNTGIRSNKWWANLAENYHNNLYLRFAIDGVDQESNEKYRIGVDFNKAFTNMKSFIDNYGQGTWHFLVFTWNWHLIPQAAKMAKDIGINIHFKINNRNYGCVTPDERVKAIKLIEEAYNE